MWGPAGFSGAIFIIFLNSVLHNLNFACGATQGAWGTAELSEARSCLAGTALSRTSLALFAGGITGVGSGGYYDVTAAVDIYNGRSNSWSTASLSEARGYPTATSLEEQSMALFAGGTRRTLADSGFLELASSAVDIYSSVTGTWATATLSSPRFGLASASVSSLGLALFAGGKLSSNSSSDVVDIYNGLTNRWATARLSLARFYLSAASLSMGNQSFVLFAGGFSTDGATTSVVDIYSCFTQTMSIASLRSARGLMASASLDMSSIGAKSLAIFAGGATGTLKQRVADDTIEFFDGERWASSKLGHNKYNLQSATLDKEGLAIFAGGLIPTGPETSYLYSDAECIYFAKMAKTTKQMAQARAEFAAASLAQEGFVLFAGGVTYEKSDFSSSVDIYCHYGAQPVNPNYIYTPYTEAKNAGPCAQKPSDGQLIGRLLFGFSPAFALLHLLYAQLFLRELSREFAPKHLSRIDTIFWMCKDGRYRKWIYLAIFFGGMMYCYWRVRLKNKLLRRAPTIESTSLVSSDNLQYQEMKDLDPSDLNDGPCNHEIAAQPLSMLFYKQQLSAVASHSDAEHLLARRQWRRFVSYEGNMSPGYPRIPCWNLKHDCFETIPIVRDGHCLFRCFSRILKNCNTSGCPQGDELDVARRLREIIAVDIRSKNGSQNSLLNGKPWSVQVEGEVDPHCEAIFLGNRGVNSYGGIDEVVSFCNIFKITILLHAPEVHDPLLINSKNVHEDNPEVLLFTLGWDLHGERAPGADHWQMLMIKSQRAARLQQSSLASLPYQIISDKDLKVDVSSPSPAASGSFGEVHKCTWLGHEVAVKRFHDSADFLKFDQEARLMHQIQFPHCVRMYGACVLPSHAIVMEWMGGGNLREYLMQRPLAPMHRRMSLFRQICSGLNSLHSHSPHPIIHSDLKPANILLDSDKRVAKIADFGLSKIKAASSVSSHVGGGTLLYLAPEIVLHASSSRRHTDVFAMGLMLWELLSGKIVWQDDDGTCLTPGQLVSKYSKQERPSLSAISDSVDPDIVLLMQDCWKENPDQRPTAEELWRRMSVLDVNNSDFNQPLIAFRKSWLTSPCSLEDCFRRALPESAYKLLLRELPAIEEKYRQAAVQELVQSYKLSEIEAKCIIIYTLVWPAVKCPRDCQLYFLFCKAYRDRNDTDLEKFANFSFHFWNGIGKLPKRAEQLFRGLDRRLLDISDMYEVGNIVHWHYPSSSTTDMRIASSFSRGGTLISFVGVTEAVSIQTFSLNPSERELILPYTSSFLVEVALSSEKARLLAAFGSLPDNVDLVVLRSRNEVM